MDTWEEAGVLNQPRRTALATLLDRADFLLSGFQVRATERMLRDLDGTWSRGSIITVGTGSGKTLAFYLPALAHITSLIVTGQHWTKAIAIYPRNELLKDQFSDTYVEARRLDATLLAQGRRKLTIGAFFGPTPKRAESAELKEKGWENAPGGYICPYLRCPACGGELVWRRTDLEEAVERLACAACAAVVEEDEVYLTRRRMQQTPPDVLFTTTEMLNRVMGDSTSRHIFGLGVPTAPQIVLLDEVHTYAGTHGAQVAMLLRRWRHAVQSRVQFTGLSATLRNAPEFFARLTGLPENAVEEIAPAPHELERAGMEYMLVLRGDPVSKTSLLSTTIQVAMLLRRVLDPPSRDPLNTDSGPEGMHGRKIFVFTDDLDVTNRLFHNLLDAEGVNQRNIPKPGRAPLAALRSRGQPESVRRLQVGQSWYLCEEIGHSEGLRTPLIVGRTSSQDVGVNRQADVIVATASLEVGYNDPAVGAVLQHKAPRDAASFVQRKGRAGRLRRMRPWTVVVLSDYGRDRIAYQGYESLFDPVLPPRVLPIANRYVLRIQAVFTFMDWLALQLRGAPTGTVYLDFSGPSRYPGPAARQQREAQIVRRVLEGDDSLIASLERYLASALAIQSDEVIALMWEPPRSIMMQVLPTLLRRLESGWRRVPLRSGESGRDYVITNSPLPDFVPASLFSDLNLPEVTIITSDGRGDREDQLSIDQALRTLVPGKVTRRFAVRSSNVSHWIPLPSLDPSVTRHEIAVEDICSEFEEIGPVQIEQDGAPMELRCVRPWTVRPAVVPRQVYPTSNAWPEWRSQIFPAGLGISLELPDGSAWRENVLEISLHAHARRSSVEVRRFAIGARANVRLRGHNVPELQAEVRFIERDSRGPAALGFTAHVDGVRFLTAVPTVDLVRADDQNRGKVRAFRTAYFRHRVLNDPVLATYANTFQREWLCQVYLSALTAWAIKDSPNLAEANEAMAPVVAAAADKVLRVIFETLFIEEDEDEDEDRVDGAAARVPEQQRRLRDEVIALFRQRDVVQRLQHLAHVLWEAPDAEWHAWSAKRYLATLGGALLEACRQLYPEAGADDLLLDIDPGMPSVGTPAERVGTAEIWITEVAIGGGGVVEEIARRYIEDPRRFFRLVESALGPSDREVTDAELTRILSLIDEDRDVAQAVERVRRASRHEELQAAVVRLEEVFESRGVLVSRTIMSAIHARIIRPGSNPTTDSLLLDLIRQWHRYEERLGVEVDARVFAYLQSEGEALSEALAHIDQDVTRDRGFRFHAIYGLLWPRGNLIRSLALASYNPFAPLPDADRELVADRIVQRVPSVQIAESDWRLRVTEALRVHGEALLIAGPEDRVALRAAVLTLAADPLEVDYLHVHPRVEGIVWGADGFEVTLTLSESVQ
jgi:hypothetical protein